MIASNFDRPHNPAWYYNLRSNPNATIVVDGVRREVVARELSGSDREREYQRGEKIFPAFTHYRHWTTNRKIPVQARAAALNNSSGSASPTLAP